MKTLLVAFILCLFCSAIVSTTAVTLRPKQEYNKDIDMKKNVLKASGEAFSESDDIKTVFNNMITSVYIDMDSGSVVSELSKDDKKIEVAIPDELDRGGLSTRKKYTQIYLKKDSSGSIQNIILPISSKGLWSTMLGFVALESDAKTVKGFSYYSHGETPGLGGEVDNPKWKAQWIGKKVFDENGNPKIDVTKNNTGSVHEVDALSGATITGDGVESSMLYWLSDHGYGKFLDKVKEGVL